LNSINEPILKVDRISKSYPSKVRKTKDSPKTNRVDILDNISFEVGKGSFTSIIGPSGCGKTTILKIIDGLVKPDSGQVIFDGEIVDSPPDKMAFVFQQFGLLPWRTALKNVEFGLELEGVDPDERRNAALRYLEIVGLKGYEQHYVHEISSGMQQRVGLARALAINPEILLMDEPFASIDMQTREMLQRQLFKIVRGEIPKTTLFVTHNVDEAIFLSDEILLLGTHPAEVKERIPVDLPLDRSDYDVRSSSEYGVIRNRVWKFLEKEIMEKNGFGSYGT
jgi:NitT/TauT family transport system ATP-binding protein